MGTGSETHRKITMGIRPRALEICPNFDSPGARSRWVSGLERSKFVRISTALEQDHSGYPASSARNLSEFRQPWSKITVGIRPRALEICPNFDSPGARSQWVPM